MTTPLASLGCSAAACSSPAAVQWRRRNASGGTDAVFGCPVHAITVDAAAHVHVPTCTAPDPARVPACNCTPEPLPPGRMPDPATQTLPTGWTIPVVRTAAPVVTAMPSVPQAPSSL